MQAIKEELELFRNNHLDQITLECESHSAITEEVPACVLAMANQFAPRYWNRLIAVSLSGCNLELFPVCLKICECLEELNISNNLLRRLPSQLLVQYFPFLKILDVSNNCLTDLHDIQLLGQLLELEVLSVQGNNFSKIESRTELISGLLFSGIQPVKYFKKENNRMSVFMNIGEEEVVLNNQRYVEALKRLVKAAEYLKTHDLCELKNGKYEMTQLPVDAVSLHDGSLFQVRGNVWLKGPGVTLIKDDRIEAPFIVVTTNEESDIVGITPQTQNFVILESGEFDEILATTNSAYVDSRSMKYGFFGEKYFCYDMPLKTRERQENERELSTIDLIKKSTTRDQRIISTANEAKLSKAKLDINAMLPSKIEKSLREQFQEMHFITNLNERQLYTEQLFERLRVLDGEIITISEYDQAEKSYNDARSNRILMLQAAEPLEQSNVRAPKINPSYKQAENGGRITGEAAVDLKLESSAINITKELSEEIRKREIYDRVSEQNKLDKKKAYEELKDFIQTGNLTANDSEYKFTMLLRSYDEETEPDIVTFIKESKELESQYMIDRQIQENENLLDNGIVSNVLVDQELTMSERYMSNYGILSKPNDSSAAELELSTLEEDIVANEKATKELNHDDILLRLSEEMKSTRIIDSSAEEDRQADESEYSPLEHSKETTQNRICNIEMALMESESAIKEATDCSPKHHSVQESHLVPPFEVQPSNLEEMRPYLSYSNPLQHIENSTGIYAEAAEYKPAKEISESLISKPHEKTSDTIKGPLPLESGHISFEDMKQLPDVVKQSVSGLNNTCAKELLPLFDELLKYELESEHTATNELFKHVAVSVDPAIRRELAIPEITVPAKDSLTSDVITKRHPAILDVITEGDRLRAAPNKIVDSENVSKMISYTTEETMQQIDSEIMRQNIAYELEREGEGGQSTINVMLKQNNKDIENQEVMEKRKEHLQRLSLIKKEKEMPEYYVKPSGQQILLSKEERKVQEIEHRNESFTNRRQTVLGQREEIKKEPIGVSDVLNIETVEDAAERAKLLNIGASELIDAGNHIMANAEFQINELHEYGNDFVRGEMEWDNMEEDEVYKLLRSKDKLCSENLYLEIPLADIPLTDESRKFGVALQRGKDTRGIFSSCIEEAKEIAEDILENIELQ